MDKSRPVRIPFWVRWRGFRWKVMPILVFGLTLTAVVLFWDYTRFSGVSAIAEAELGLLSAPQDGQLTRMLARPYDFVASGQPIAILKPIDPRLSFDLLQAEFALARMRTQPTVAEDNAINYERIRVELLRTKAELEMAKVRLARAERDVERSASLHRENLLSDEVFETVQATRDIHRAEVESKENAVRMIEQRLEDLNALGVPRAATADLASATLERLEALKNRTRTQLEPITLTAPQSGLVHEVYRQTGENVVSGEPLVSISPVRSDRIVGYLRQPYRFDLKVGMPVEVSTRERQRRVFTSEVTRVGARVEPITNALAMVSANIFMDAGLPFVIGLPADIDIRPGEVVDVQFDVQETLFGWPGSAEASLNQNPSTSPDIREN